MNSDILEVYINLKVTACDVTCAPVRILIGEDTLGHTD